MSPCCAAKCDGCCLQSIEKRTLQRSGNAKKYDTKEEGAGKTFKAGYLNSAFVLIQPHANTKLTQDYVRRALQAHGLAIDSEGTINSTEIDENQFVDDQKATIPKPLALPVPADKFDVFFGSSCESVRFVIFC